MLQCFGVGMFCLMKFWRNDTLRGEVFHAAWFWVVRFFVRHCFCAVRFLLNDVLRSEAFCMAWLRGEVFHVAWFGSAEIDM